MTSGTLIDEPTLFARLGGTPAIEAAVRDFYTRVLADDELVRYFDGIDLDRLRTHQRAFLAGALGGRQHYRGRSLAEAHRGLRITDAEFQRVVGHLVETLRSLSVDVDTITEVVEALAPLEPEIVAAND